MKQITIVLCLCAAVVVLWLVCRRKHNDERYAGSGAEDNNGDEGPWKLALCQKRCSPYGCIPSNYTGGYVCADAVTPFGPLAAKVAAASPERYPSWTGASANSTAAPIDDIKMTNYINEATCRQRCYQGTCIQFGGGANGRMADSSWNCVRDSTYLARKKACDITANMS